MNVTLKSNTLNSTAYGLQNKVIKAEDEKSKKEILKEALEKIKKAVEGTHFKTEEEKDRYQKKLNEKIKLGSKLSQSEMDYIQKTNPMMYIRIKRVQMQREMLENKLKQCKSKKEVEETYNQTMSAIDDKDPDRQMLGNAYNNVTKEFKNTREYKNLPSDIKDKKKEKSVRENETNIDLSV